MEGRIEAECNGRKSVLSRCFSTYPIKLIRQESWHNHVSIIALGFGGGLVEGDRNDLQVKLKSGAQVSLRTQGSTKVFKTTEQKITVNYMKVMLQSKSLFTYLPDPTACFPDSRYKQSLKCYLEEGASLVLVDWFTSGRQERDKAWGLQLLENDILIQVGSDNTLFVEHQKLENTSFGSVKYKVGNVVAYGSVILVGPQTLQVRERLRALQQRQTYLQVRDNRSQQQQQQQQQRNFANPSHKRSRNDAVDAVAAAGVPAPAAATADSAVDACWDDDGGDDEKLISPSLLVSVSDLGADNCSKILRFAVEEVEEGYELLAEVLKPLGVHMPGCEPYQDRLHASCWQSRYTATHPVQLLRQYDADHERTPPPLSPLRVSPR